MRRKMIFDRFEDESAVLISEEKKVIIPKSSVPAGIKPGDTVLLSHGVYSIDSKDTEKRQNRIAEKIKKLNK